MLPHAVRDGSQDPSTRNPANGGHNISNIGNFYGALETQTRDGFVVENAEHQILLGEDQSPVITKSKRLGFALNFFKACRGSALVMTLYP